MARQRSLSSLFSRRRQPEASPEPAAPTADHGAVRAEAFLHDGTIPLLLYGPAGRLTDLLNAGAEDLRLERTDGGDPPSLEEILVLVPPPREGDRQRRLHRPGRAVLVRIGPYEITGDAHIPPGAQPTGFLLRTNPRFAPLTGATIRSTSGAIADRRVDVALVNLRRADRFRDVTAEDQT